MKRFMHSFLALAMMATMLMSIPAYAAVPGTEGTAPITAAAAMPRATTKPTSRAPASWYDVDHQWTAKNYTYTSYHFLWGSQQSFWFLARADKAFTLEVYNSDTDALIDSIPAEWDSDYFGGTYRADWSAGPPDDNPGIYCILRNTSGSTISTSDNAYYNVGKI